MRRYRALASDVCSLVRLFEKGGVLLYSSGALGDETEEGFTGVDSGITQAPTENLSSNCGFGSDVRTSASVESARCSTRDRLVLAPVTSTGCGPPLDDRNTHGLGAYA